MTSRSRALLIVGAALTRDIIVVGTPFLVSGALPPARPSITARSEAAERDETRRAIQAIRERERLLDERDAADGRR